VWFGPTRGPHPWSCGAGRRRGPGRATAGGLGWVRLIPLGRCGAGGPVTTGHRKSSAFFDGVRGGRSGGLLLRAGHPGEGSGCHRRGVRVSPARVRLPRNGLKGPLRVARLAAGAWDRRGSSGDRRGCRLSTNRSGEGLREGRHGTWRVPTAEQSAASLAWRQGPGPARVHRRPARVRRRPSRVRRRTGEGVGFLTGGSDEGLGEGRREVW